MDKAYIKGYINTREESQIVFFREFTKSFRETIQPGAFTESIKTYGRVPLYFNHKRYITSIVEVTENDKGIIFTAWIDDLEVLAKCLYGKMKGCSFSFENMKETIVDKGEYLNTKIIEEMKLKEISVLDIKPAYTSGVTIESISSELRSKVNDYYSRSLICGR
jgi:HK97 family phage prohead protease